MHVKNLLQLIFECLQLRHVAKSLLVVPCVDLDMLETQRLTLALIDTKALPENQGEAIDGVLKMLDYWADVRDDQVSLVQLSAQISLTAIKSLEADDFPGYHLPRNKQQAAAVAELERIAKGGKL